MPTTEVTAQRAPSGLEDPAPGRSLDVGAQSIARSPDGHVRLITLSSRAGLVTGGDVLITEVDDGSSSGPMRIVLDGKDVALGDNLDAGSDGLWKMHVRGITEHSVLSVTRGNGAEATATLAMTNHATTGPLFAGPQSSLFFCATQRFFLGPPQDSDCSVPTVFSWSYVNAAKQLVNLADPGTQPRDMAMTTVNNRSVPFIVRQESGVLDRGIYEIAVLDPDPDTAFDATTSHAPWGSSQPSPTFFPGGWNQRLVYRFGGGCNTTYANAQRHSEPVDLELLGRGYAIATSTLNSLANLCNTVVSAENTAMVKERFIEGYGVPVHTIADGGSGGAIQQIQIVQNQPGLLDGIAPSLPFADVISIAAGLTDCGLMNRYRATPTGRQLREEQWAAIEGMLSTLTCVGWEDAFLDVVDPRVGCDLHLAASIYDPLIRPGGLRCTLQDSNVNIYGRDPVTGFARRPIDNAGVPYGLKALNVGLITTDQFLDLNEGIGGYDIDGKIIASRTVADEGAIRAAYSSGQVTAGGALWDVPIIARNVYNDAKGDIHDRFRAFSLRDRLTTDDGATNPNLVIWTFESKLPVLDSLQTPDAQGVEPLYVLDEWLTMAEAAPVDVVAGVPSATAKLLRRPTAGELAVNRPVYAVDLCKIEGQLVVGADVYESGPCHDAFPIHGDARIASGEERRDDILKCATRPPDDAWFALQPARFDDRQRQRLARIFVDGICDWSRAGVGQVPFGGPWQTFG